MITEIFNDPIKLITYEDIRALSEANTFSNARFLSPLMDGGMRGQLKIGSALPGDNSFLLLDGTGQRIIINDGTNDTVLIGEDGT